MITSAPDEQRIEDVRTDDRALTVRLVDGRILSVPLGWHPGLLDASEEQRNDWRLIGGGVGVHWPQIDEDLSLDGMLRGVRSTAQRPGSSSVSSYVNEAARSFAETLAESYRVVYGQAAESSERQQQRAREFSELVSSNLSEQAEAGRTNAQRLSEQTARQQEASQQLARESVEAYTRFLDEAFSRYSSSTEQAAQSTREGTRTLAETTTGLFGTATGAVNATAGATVEGAERAAEAAVFPIEGYDEMNVGEISGRLDGLAVEELQLVRDYEETNKKRETILERMDRKIRAS